MIVLPLLTWLGLWFLLVNLDTERAWRKNFLRSALLCGAWLLISTELFSLKRQITLPGIVCAWLLLLGSTVISAWLVLRKQQKLTWQSNFEGLRSWPHVLLVSLLLTVFLITALVAYLSPPNESETLRYRMARVVHWVQNRSIAHYLTPIEIQNSYAPWLEYAFLHTYLLGNGDRFVSFVSWFAILGCAIGVSLLAERLGAGLTGQLLASLFAATLPLAIVQATSTMHEGVLAFWMVCVAVEFLLLWQGRENPYRSALFLALGAGLGLATKPLIAPFLLPFAIATAIVLIGKKKPAYMLLPALLTAIICLALNAGYLWRNYKTYHTWLDATQTRHQSNEMRNWQGMLSNLLRNAAMQASTPWDAVNYQITRLVVGIHFKLGIDVNDPRTTSIGEFWVCPLNTSDGTSPASFHAWAMLLAFIPMVLRPKTLGRQGWIYHGLLIGGYLAFCYLFKWQVFGTRYILPLFMLYAPLVGIILTTRRPTVNSFLGIAFFLMATPWLFSLKLRPLVPRPGTYPASVLTASREELYFSGAKGAYLPYKSLAAKILASDCSDIGLYLSGASPEYLWWVVLGAPHNRIRIEWLMGSESAQYFDPTFSPCAIISDDDDPKERLFGLPLLYRQDNLSLYQKNEGNVR